MRMCQKLWGFGFVLVILFNVPSSLIKCKAMDFRENKTVVNKICCKTLSCNENNLKTRNPISNNCTHYFECAKFEGPRYAFTLNDCEDPFVFDEKIQECVMPPLIPGKKFNRTTCSFLEDSVRRRTRRKAESITAISGERQVLRSHSSSFSAFTFSPNEDLRDSSEVFSTFSGSGWTYHEETRFGSSDFVSKPSKPNESEETSFGSKKWESSWSDIDINPPLSPNDRKLNMPESNDFEFSEISRQQPDRIHFFDSMKHEDIRGRGELLNPDIPDISYEAEKEKLQLESPIHDKMREDLIPERSQQFQIDKPSDNGSPHSLSLVPMRNTTRQNSLPKRPQQIPNSKYYGNGYPQPPNLKAAALQDTSVENTIFKRPQESAEIKLDHPQSLIKFPQTNKTRKFITDNHHNPTIQNPIINSYNNGSGILKVSQTNAIGRESVIPTRYQNSPIIQSDDITASQRLKYNSTEDDMTEEFSQRRQSQNSKPQIKNHFDEGVPRSQIKLLTTRPQMIPQRPIQSHISKFGENRSSLIQAPKLRQDTMRQNLIPERNKTKSPILQPNNFVSSHGLKHDSTKDEGKEHFIPQKEIKNEYNEGVTRSLINTPTLTRADMVQKSPQLSKIAKPYENRSSVIQTPKHRQDKARENVTPERKQNSPIMQADDTVSSHRLKYNSTQDEKKVHFIQERQSQNSRPQIQNHYDENAPALTTRADMIPNTPQVSQIAKPYENRSAVFQLPKQRQQDTTREKTTPVKPFESPVMQPHVNRSPNIFKATPTEETIMRDAIPLANEPHVPPIIQPYGAVSSRSMNSIPNQVVETRESENVFNEPKPRPIVNELPLFPTFPKFGEVKVTTIRSVVFGLLHK